MAETMTFEELVRRVRAGDQEAAQELVRRYEPAIRRAIRFRIDTRLGRVLDSMDICQSVLASFFVRAASGQFDIDQPEQLLKLLVAMARHKLAHQIRRERAQRRDQRRLQAEPIEEAQVSTNNTPSREAMARDLLEQVQRRLSPEERLLVQLRNDGHEWAAIAQHVGGSPEALRKRLARALDRVSTELGLDSMTSHD